MSVEAEITDVTANGAGVAKIDGYPLFVKNAVTGDKLRIRVTKTNKNYGFAENMEIISPSKYRRKPECKSFLKCGGCDLMHISYDLQLELKSGFVTGNMHRIGGYSEDEYVFEGIIGAQKRLGYRNKAQFPVGNCNGEPVCGFYSKKSHDIIPINGCLIQDEKINEVCKLILKYANEAGLSAYNEDSHSGILRHIYIRSAGADGELMAVIVTNSEKPLPREERLAELLSGVDGVKCIIQNINTKKSNVILGDKNRVIRGEGYIISRIGNLRFKISPQSFFQVNPQQTEKLYEKALEYADLKGTETVFDLYCGVGSISLFLASRAKKVIGVEIVNEAVKNAIENARLNGIDNAYFYAGDCAEVVNKLAKSGERADIAVVDPPRKGCSGELLKLIRDMSPKKLVYISCNSATLARDAKILREYGYKLEKLCAVDMFAHTTHVETVCLLSKLKSTQHIEVDLSMDELDLTAAESKATYENLVKLRL